MDSVPRGWVRFDFFAILPDMREDRPLELVPATAELEPLSATLAAAFQDDPALAWIVPDPTKRRKTLPRFFNVMAEQSRRHGEILASPDRRAASLWYPPGEVREGVFHSVLDNLRLAAQFGLALPRGIRMGDEVHGHHPHPQPFSYLRFVGVSPIAQGKGWGGALVRAGVNRAAESGLGVLLETATQSNVAIYVRLGFETIAEWEMPGGGPKFWTMVHPAP